VKNAEPKKPSLEEAPRDGELAKLLGRNSPSAAASR